MSKVEVEKEEGEVRIAVDKATLEKLEKAAETLDELKKRTIEAVRGTETELYIKFDKLTLNGEVTIKIAPRKRE